MTLRFASSLAAFVFIAGCGRSQLYPSELEELAASGSGGTGPTGTAGSKATGGAAGRAGASSSGGKPSTAGAPMVAGMPSDGGSIGMAGEGGEGGAPVHDCLDGKLHIEQVGPANATSSFDSAKEPVWVLFDCPYDVAALWGGAVRLYGQQIGYVNQYYAITNDGLGFQLSSGQSSFLPGERVTVWLGAELGGPYFWQYTEHVSADSPGQFVAGTQDLSALSQARDFVLADLDGDRDLDLVVGAYQADMQLWLNDGTGTFDAGGTVPSQGAPAVADVDHDRDLDIFGEGPLLLNNGDGTFESGPSYSGCMVAGDLDGDGDLDCVQYGGYRPDQTSYGYVLFNQDGRKFEQGPETPFGSGCDVADLDGDADLDVVCLGYSTRAFFNDGQGAFTPSKQKLGEIGSRDLAIGDVDGDHDFDLVVAVWYGGGKYRANELWLNDGSGTFSAGGGIGAEGGEIELGDLDGDGDLDLIVSALPPYGPSQGPFHPMHVYENDGKGAFHDTGRTVGDPSFQWFKLGDLDGDGDLDAFVFHQVGKGDNYSSVWFNRE